MLYNGKSTTNQTSVVWVLADNESITEQNVVFRT